MATDISERSGFSPDELTIVAGTMFFTASDGTDGSQLWKMTAVTADDAVEVKDQRCSALGVSVTIRVLDPVGGSLASGYLFFTIPD